MRSVAGCGQGTLVPERGGEDCAILRGMLSTAEALAAIPEPPGVTLWRCPPYWESKGLAVEVWGVAGTAGPGGRGEEKSVPVAVELDRAHDLSWRGPEAWVWPESGGRYGVMRWTVVVLGFIEHEAREAFGAVCAAIDGREALTVQGQAG